MPLWDREALDNISLSKFSTANFVNFKNFLVKMLNAANKAFIILCGYWVWDSHGLSGHTDILYEIGKIIIKQRSG